MELTTDANPAHRLQAFLALRERDSSKVLERIPAALVDPDPMVRFVALQSVSEHDAKQFRPAIEQQMVAGATSRSLFEAYLATLAHLDGERHRPDQEVAGEDYVVRLLLDPNTASALRPRALRMLRPDHPSLTLARLKGWLSAPDPALQVEAVRTLRESTAQERIDVLTAIAGETSRSPSSLRAEAIVRTACRSSRDAETNLSVLPAARIERSSRETLHASLRGASLSNAQREQISRNAKDPESLALVAMLSKPVDDGTRPATSDREAWLKLLDGPADAAAEPSRIFFHPRGPGLLPLPFDRGTRRQGRARPFNDRDGSSTAGQLDRTADLGADYGSRPAIRLVVDRQNRRNRLQWALDPEETPSGDQVGIVDSRGEKFTLKPSRHRGTPAANRFGSCRQSSSGQ